MINKVEFIKHRLFEPNYYQRKLDNDLPIEPSEGTKKERTKRAFLIALPFLSLHRPFASVISLSFGTLRISSKLIEVFDARDLSDSALRVLQLGLAALAVVATLYNFSLGMVVTTSADLIQSLTSTIQALAHADSKLAIEESLQTLSSTLYLGILFFGSLEIVIASILTQAIVSLYQASCEYEKDLMPEFLAKLAMGSIRLFQASGQYQLLQRRNDLVKHYKQLTHRIQKGREIHHLWNHPAISIAMEGHALEDADGNTYDFGNNFHSIGGQLVKGMNINFRKNDDRKVLQFKINHVFRKRLEQSIVDLKKAKNEDVRGLLSLFGSHAERIKISEEVDLTGYFKEYVIDLEGLGRIQLGKTSDVHTLHTRITVEMEDRANLYEFHEALALFGLDDALRNSANEDLERMKLGHLFHMFSPREATLFVREDAYFDLPIESFKEEILRRAPEMHTYIDKWSSRLTFRETLPGKMRICIDGLGEEVQNAGVRGLSAGLMGAWSDDEIHERLISILKMGMISSESRHLSDFNRQGLSFGADYMTGGADSVFTQMVTNLNNSFDDFYYKSNARIHFSPKVFESGTYQSHDDTFGTRNIGEEGWWWEDSYLDRPNLPDFIAEEKAHFHYGHEVMVKDRISPEWITGISVSHQSLKDSLLDDLRKRKIIELDTGGRERILGKLVDQFIWVGNDICDKMFA